MLTTLAVAVGFPGAATAAHLGLLGLASLAYRERVATGEPVRFLTVIPAHNEESVIGRCLTAVNADRRPGDEVLVVADRCRDATVATARALGALVLERGDDEEPGRAAARQAGLERARDLDWDVVVMLDADSVIERGFYDACGRALTPGTPAVQARSESARGSGLAAEASLAAFTLQGITIPRGRDRLGLPVRLRGTGMAIRRRVALSHRFHAPASEDLFFTMDLLLAGIRCRHVDSARLRSDGAPSWDAFGGQKVRYEAGRMAAARVYVPRLLARAVRHRDAACLEAAWFLATPPFAIAVLSLAAGVAVATVADAPVAVALFAAGLGVAAFTLVTGLVQGRAGWRTWLALLAAPGYVVWKASVQVRAALRLARRDAVFGPTARA